MDKQRSNAFMLKVVADVATTLASTLLIVGDRTGLFKAMAGAGPLTGAELAERADIAPRYADEWLAAMAGAGYVEYDPSTARFTLPDEHALFLADPASEYYLAGLFAGLPTMATVIPRLTEAFRTGSGIAFSDFGAELPMALAAMNRSVYENRLVKSWLPALPGVVEKLRDGGRAVDVGCGMGVVPIALARAFPKATIAGLKRSRWPTINLAREALAAAMILSASSRVVAIGFSTRTCTPFSRNAHAISQCVSVGVAIETASTLPRRSRQSPNGAQPLSAAT